MTTIRTLLAASALVLTFSAAQASEEAKKEETPVVAGETAPATTDVKPVDGTAPVAGEEKKEETK